MDTAGYGIGCVLGKEENMKNIMNLESVRESEAICRGTHRLNDLEQAKVAVIKLTLGAQSSNIYTEKPNQLTFFVNRCFRTVFVCILFEILLCRLHVSAGCVP